jgi:hypothetical protein
MPGKQRRLYVLIINVIVDSIVVIPSFVCACILFNTASNVPHEEYSAFTVFLYVIGGIGCLLACFASAILLLLGIYILV